MISCEKAVHLCNKSQYKESTLWERIKLTIHLYTCKVCSAYSKKNSKLTSLCEQANMFNLSEADKAEMKKVLEKEKIK